MPIDIIDLARLIGGIILIIIPGYLWSYVFLSTIQWYERILFGFCTTLLGCSFILFTVNMFLSIDITHVVFWLIYSSATIIAIILLFFLWLRKKEKNHLFQALNEKIILVLKNPKTWVIVGILIFSGTMMFLPHIREGYYLPFHVDEWEHWVLTRSVMGSGSTSFINPYLGTGILQPQEIGFHLITASIVWASVCQLNTIFVFMPFLIGVLLSLVAFCIGDRCKPRFGMYAGFIVAFIPTTCRMMGPSFFVPVSLGLVFVGFCLWLAQQEKIIGSLLLAGTISSTFIMHAPTALAELIVVLSYAFFLLFEKKYRLSLATIGGITAPIIIVLIAASRWTGALDLVIDAFFYGGQFSSLDMDLPKIWVEFDHLGIVVWILAILGVYFSFTRGRTIHRSLSLSVFGFIGFIGLYSNFGYGLPIMYERSFLFLFLTITIIAGYTTSVIVEIIHQLINHRMSFIQ